ncbi:MAG TPA: hypothetical protein VK612_06975 [Pyrinomonadaceae bacterium]|nr:hypothetical protein [Pyrinomonadaceae bacterium]
MADELFADSLMKIKIWAGAIGANGDLDDMKAAAIVAQKRIDFALQQSTLFQGSNSSAYQKLVDANEYLGKIVEYLEAAETIQKDFKAVQQIYFAIQVLKDDQIMFNDSEKAAKAFDSLFLGFGTLAKHFPPPFDSTIGELLSKCGELAFFSNMRNTMVGPNSNLGRAMYLRDNM